MTQPIVEVEASFADVHDDLGASLHAAEQILTRLEGLARELLEAAPKGGKGLVPRGPGPPLSTLRSVAAAL